MLSRYRKIQEERAQGDEEGFTLIELLIVIVVLAILAAVTVFGLSNVTSQSAAAACHADAKSVEIALEAYHTQMNNAWPAASPAGNLTLAPLPPVAPGTVRYLRTWPNNPNHYVITIDAAGNVLVAPNGGAAVNYDTPAPANPCDAVT